MWLSQTVNINKHRHEQTQTDGHIVFTLLDDYEGEQKEGWREGGEGVDNIENKQSWIFWWLLIIYR